MRLTSTSPLVLLAALVAPASAQVPSSSSDGLPGPDVGGTRGATVGYVADQRCKICHLDVWETYQDVGMAQSFARPRAEVLIEDFEENNSFYHEPSRRHYEMRRDGDRIFFKRYQVDDDAQEVNVFETEIDGIVGSGHRSRVYVIRTPEGELYQLPIAWYPQNDSWGMAPGFDKAGHLGLLRRVRRECMFCHNAYPDVPAGSDAPAAPHVFPAELPEGTGCQRCHGPGEEHVRLAIHDRSDMERLRTSVVNPAKLSPERRDDVCDQCHLQSAVAIPAVRRIGVAEYSFRPGQTLADFNVPVDVVLDGEDPRDPGKHRFEINHHPYRLRQSRCFEVSGRALNCLTCHNPHRKVPAEQRPAHYRAACLSCHQLEDCQVEAMGAADEMQDGGDCVSCHMPQRRTSDVVEVVMTDHKITRRPEPEGERLRPLQEKDESLVDILLLPGAPEGAMGQVYRALGVLRFGESTAAAEFLERTFAAAEPSSELGNLQASIELLAAQLRMRRFPQARETARRILARDPDNLRVRELLLVAKSSVGWTAEDAKEIRRIVAESTSSNTWFNAGLILASTGDLDAALDHFRRSAELNPLQSKALFYVGRLLLEQGKNGPAVEYLQRALNVEPVYTRAYLALAEAYMQRGDFGAAQRVLRHGAVHAQDPGKVRAALEKLEEQLDDEH